MRMTTLCWAMGKVPLCACSSLLFVTLFRVAVTFVVMFAVSWNRLFAIAAVSPSGININAFWNFGAHPAVLFPTPCFGFLLRNRSPCDGGVRRHGGGGWCCADMIVHMVIKGCHVPPCSGRQQKNAIEFEREIPWTENSSIQRDDTSALNGLADVAPVLLVCLDISDLIAEGDKVKERGQLGIPGRCGYTMDDRPNTVVETRVDVLKFGYCTIQKRPARFQKGKKFVFVFVGDNPEVQVEMCVIHVGIFVPRLSGGTKGNLWT